MSSAMTRIWLILGLWGSVTAVFAGTLSEQPKLIYASNRSGDFNLFVFNADGSDPVNLSNTNTSDLYPAWSPDGKHIVYSSERNGYRALYIMDADGSNVRQLTKDTIRDGAAAWSPDGKKIAFSRPIDGGNLDIFVIDVDGSHLTNLTNDPAYDMSPAWSPDGKKIAFSSNRGGVAFRIYVMDADGKNVQDVSKCDCTMGYMYPAWSPDGKTLTFADMVDAGLEIFSCSPSGEDRRQLTKLGGWNTHAAWSPDGKRIAFQHYTPGSEVGSLYTMDASGANPVKVLEDEGPLDGGRPAWKPK
jgi:Tol biopolymer transport system component